MPIREGLVSVDAMNTLDKPPLSTCPVGHDLTAPSAYLYRNSGQRECRECVMKSSGKKKKIVTKGVFNGGTKNE